MNLKHFVLCFCLSAMQTVAGQAVSFFANSNISQIDADHRAVQGIFTQQGYNTNAIKKLEKANPKLLPQGLFVKTVNTDAGFQAQAILDIDVFLSDLQTKMSDLHREIQTLEGTTERFINNRLYIKAAKDLEIAKTKYQILKQYLLLYASIMPLNNMQQFKQNLSELEKRLTSRISGITLEANNSNGNQSKPEIPILRIRVTDAFGPLPNFPLTARQDKFFYENRTLTNGEISFFLQNLNFEDGPHEIVIEPSLPPEILSKIGNDKKMKIFYSVQRNNGAEQLLCKQKNINCNSLREMFERYHLEKNESNSLEIDVSNLSAKTDSPETINRIIPKKQVSN